MSIQRYGVTNIGFLHPLDNEPPLGIVAIVVNEADHVAEVERATTAYDGVWIREDFHLAAVEAMRAACIAAVEAAHTPKNYGERYGLNGEYFDFLVCEECSSMCHSETGLRCDQPGDAVWPCAEMSRVIAALREVTPNA